MKHFTLTLLILCSCSFFCEGQINIIENKSPRARIIVDKQDSTDFRAALLLQDFAERITGAKLEILEKESKPKAGDILIGKFQLPIAGLTLSQITEDGFYLSTNDQYLRIVGNEGKGSIYGVVTLLEDYFGIRYYAQNTYTLNRSINMDVPAGINRLENPSFRYRQVATYNQADSIYKLWHRLEQPNEVFAERLWVHTFNHLLPSDEFGEKHPEYYSFVTGQRRPGHASQWCLTNPEVFDIVAHRLDSIFKKNPEQKIISVSQNDSQTHCHCDACKVIDDHEGSPSGTLVYFMNKLAERFPDKEISTLAYLYSMQPPKHIKPLPNVNIMLCNIDCYREVSLTENPSGQTFMKALVGWSAISDNIFIWDYGINFDNYISPFPNFHILQTNMQLFKDYNATMHFSQINSVKGGNFADLRAYLIAKLMWNTKLDVEALMNTFLNDYYGEAAPYIYQYIKIQEGALMGSQIPLWIYDTPITHKDGMLNQPLMIRYKALFDKAEQAVINDKVFLDRVREARLPIMYAELEIARTNPVKDIETLTDKLSLFRERTGELNVLIFNERHNTVEEYCDLYIQRNLANRKQSLALNAPVEFISAPNNPYTKIADKALTDGLYGGATYNESWVGWEGRDAEFIIDLGEVKPITSVETDFLYSMGAWILLPKSVTCYVSKDNKDFTLLGQQDIEESRERKVSFVNIPITPKESTEGRYIKVKVETIGLCPTWHHGVGYPAWFFIDEVNVY